MSTGREPDGATFTGRVGARGARPPLLAVGLLIAAAGLVAVGVGGRGAPPPSNGPLEAFATTAAIKPDPSRPRVVPPGVPRGIPTAAPILTTPDGPIVLKARRHPETMYVHGDVYVENVTWVFISLQDASGRVAGWSSITLPGAVGERDGTKPTMRFDIELAVPSERFSGLLYLQANAYDTAGTVVATTKLPILADGRLGGAASPAP